MTSLKDNVVANYLGQGWCAVMGLAFIPLYIQYLGMEAYGLIGLFAVMQAGLTLLDMGMTPTLTREMARFTAGAHNSQSICDLLRSLEILCFSLAFLLGLGVWAASGYLASDWLKAEKLPTAVVAQAISVMALVAALRFVEGIYRGSLLGLQRQVWYNGTNAILATGRHGGVLAVLTWVSTTVQAFFIWQAFISLITVAVFAMKVHRELPKPPSPPKFAHQALVAIWKFAGGMMGITVLAMLLFQIDKVILSRMLTLESFGYYMLAATIAGSLYMVIGPITQAIYPRMVELSSQNDQTALVSIYHQSAQIITILTVPAMVLLTFFAGGVVFMWAGHASIAENTAPILSVRALGTFLNGLLWIPFQCQLAYGWTSLTVKMNVMQVVVLIPALIFWVIPRYGAVGAAWIWVALNTAQILITIQLMHRRLIPDEKLHWYFADILLPIGGAVGVMLLAKAFQPTTYQDRLQWFVFLCITGSLALMVSTALADRIRPRLLSILVRSLPWRRS